MDVGAVRSFDPIPNKEDKVSDSKQAEKKRNQQLDEQKRKQEEELMNPVDRSLIAEKTNMGANIAASIIMGSIA